MTAARVYAQSSSSWDTAEESDNTSISILGALYAGQADEAQRGNLPPASITGITNTSSPSDNIHDTEPMPDAGPPASKQLRSTGVMTDEVKGKHANFENPSINPMASDSSDLKRATTSQNTVSAVSEGAEGDHGHPDDKNLTGSSVDAADSIETSKIEPVSPTSTADAIDVEADLSGPSSTSQLDKAADGRRTSMTETPNATVPSTPDKKKTVESTRPKHDVQPVAQQQGIQSVSPQRQRNRGFDWVFDLDNPRPLGPQF